jgi:hypothetical protein
VVAGWWCDLVAISLLPCDLPPAVPNDDSFFEIPCDVVIPAAVANTINANIAPRLNCKMSSAQLLDDS